MHNIFRLLIGVPDYSSSESYGEKQKLILLVGFIVISRKTRTHLDLLSIPRLWGENYLGTTKASTRMILVHPRGRDATLTLHRRCLPGHHLLNKRTGDPAESSPKLVGHIGLGSTGFARTSSARGGGGGCAARLFFFLFFPVQQTTSGIGHRVK